jgi:hypothetical protein
VGGRPADSPGARESGHFGFWSAGAKGLGDAGLSLLRLLRVPSWLIFLALLATVRGGTSFLFPTAKKKRSKENAFPQSAHKCPERAITTIWDPKSTLGE